MKQTRTLAIEGMSCDMCIRNVLEALNGVQGLYPKDVNVGSARVEYDPGVVHEEQILQAVRDAGYEARVTG